MAETVKRHWAETLFSILREQNVSLFPYIPDAGNAQLVRLVEADPVARAVLLTSEQEGVAICAGADLVGVRSALLMQSSGVGNCVNFFSLVKGAHFPVFMMITMRGEYGETNPWQYAMGQAVMPTLAAMGILPFIANDLEDLPKAAGAALAASFRGGHGAALILSQRFLGAKMM